MILSPEVIHKCTFICITHQKAINCRWKTKESLKMIQGSPAERCAWPCRPALPSQLGTPPRRSGPASVTDQRGPAPSTHHRQHRVTTGSPAATPMPPTNANLRTKGTHKGEQMTSGLDYPAASLEQSDWVMPRGSGWNASK